jgi:LuxR family maltose regulon positive regulatory protein
MATNLLTTKLHIPPVRAESVARPRLIERLNAGLEHKLTLISAPAGFGKTTLLSEWVHSTLAQPSAPKGAASAARECGPCIAWVSLDDDDNDLARFWSYIIAALQTVQAGAGQAALAMLRSTPPPPIEAVLTDLINDLAPADPRPCLIILDDWHVIIAPQVNDTAVFFLENLPPQYHLVIASRADPPWPLARLRARRELLELRAADLRFTPEEAAAFLNGAMKLGLSPEDIMALDDRTEGWIAGLQMAALSIQGRNEGRIAAFIQAFSGSHRFILDYLVEEVLERQPSATQEFLLKTSILEQLAAPLCDTVVGSPAHEALLPGSQAMLEQLEAANLFIIPLDDERRWYRYHHLFADLLRTRLEQQAGAQEVAALHSRASAWHAQHGLIAPAVSHALAAGDIVQAARLVEENALAMIYHGELTTLAGWLRALPANVVHSWPWLCIAHAWVLAYSGEMDAVEPLLQNAETAWQTSSSTGEAAPGTLAGRDSARHGAGHIAAIRAYCTMFRGDISHAAEFAIEALTCLPQEDLATRGFTALLLGSILGSQGNLAEGTRLLDDAAGINQANNSYPLAMMVLSEMALFQRLQGQLHRAADTCQRALQSRDREPAARPAGQRSPVTGFIYCRLSPVLYEWNDLDAAASYAREAITLSTRWGQKDSLHIGYTQLAQALQAIGDLDGALAALHKAKQAAVGLPWYSGYVVALEAQLALAQGDAAAAFAWAQECRPTMPNSCEGALLELDFDRRHECCILARVLIAQGKPAKALELLGHLLHMAEAAGAMSLAIKGLALQALALHALGSDEQALSVLGRALLLAEPEGYVRTFVDEGPAMADLLRQAARRGITSHYTAKLLAAFPTPELKGKAPIPGLKIEDLVEPLSERESEVLRLLATSMPTAEIADSLFISVYTVRSHIKNIYGKLDVHTRMEAAQRAAELGLL